MDILGTERNFAGLGLADLVEARDLYHWHLTHQRNVVGTAVGLYYIRTTDPWPSSRRTSTTSAAPGTRKPPRTFQNSEDPGLLLAVRARPRRRAGWSPRTSAAARVRLPVDEMVPTTLYLPDGRTVPVCVVQVDPAEPGRDPLPAWVWPSG